MEVYYGCKEVMQITGVSRARAYQILKQLREEIETKGYIMPRPGMVQAKYFCSRLRLSLADCNEILQQNKELRLSGGDFNAKANVHRV